MQQAHLLSGQVPRVLSLVWSPRSLLWVCCHRGSRASVLCELRHGAGPWGQQACGKACLCSHWPLASLDTLWGPVAFSLGDPSPPQAGSRARIAGSTCACI